LSLLGGGGGRLVLLLMFVVNFENTRCVCKFIY